MLVGDCCKVVVETLDAEGLGIVHLAALKLRIPGGAPGDVLTVRLDARSRHSEVGWSHIEEVHHRGPHHRVPTCPHAWPTRGRCGGCALAHVAPEAASTLKMQRVRESLAKHQLGPSLHWHDSVSEQRYRNRCHFVVARDGRGRAMLGSFSPRSHHIAPMDGCEVVRAPLADLAQELQNALRQLDAPIHPDPAGLRYVTLRANGAGEALLDLVVGGDVAPWVSTWIPKLGQSGLWKGISYSVNGERGNALRVGPSHCVWGDATIVEAIGPAALHLSAATFSQLNSEVAEAMYAWAARAASAPRCIVDWYCGVGGLGITVAQAHRDCTPRLIGVDSIPESIQLARRNASDAQISADYAVVDLSKQAPAWPEEPDLVLLNPPRRGLDAPVMNAIASLSRGQVVYMSCNASSFARDMKQLETHGWRFGEVHVFDMLPRTAHVELIAIARRQASQQ